MKLIVWCCFAAVFFASLFLWVFDAEALERSGTLIQAATWVALMIPAVCITNLDWVEAFPFQIDSEATK